MLNVEISSNPRKEAAVAVALRTPTEAPEAWAGLGAPAAGRLNDPAPGLTVGKDLDLIPAAGSRAEHLLRLRVARDPEADPAEWYRRAGARLARGLKDLSVREAELHLPGSGEFDLERLAEGFFLAGYQFTEYLPESARAPTRTLAVRGPKGVEAALARARTLADAVAWARDLVNRPAEDLYPDTLADEARALAKRRGLRIKVESGKDFARGFPAIHAVGKGSDRPPCLIRLDYVPPGVKARPWVLVGKGITYDSGGYDMKPLDSMFLMKKDMGGAAAILGALDALAARRVPVPVTAVLAVAENMVSGRSFRPGDVLRTRAGKTVEVKSTDAEGRLVLADALTYAGELSPAGILDLATLTGAAAKFYHYLQSPLMGSCPALTGALLASGRRTHERLVPLELLREYRDATKGTISDLRNWGGFADGNGGTLVAGGFLGHFTAGHRWGHVDMSNTSWSYADQDYCPQGATAFGTRLLVDFFEAGPPEPVAGPAPAAPAGAKAKKRR